MLLFQVWMRYFKHCYFTTVSNTLHILKSNINNLIKLICHWEWIGDAAHKTIYNDLIV